MFADWIRIAEPEGISPSSGSSTWNTADAPDSGSAEAEETPTDSPRRTTARPIASSRKDSVISIFSIFSSVSIP